MRGNRLTLLDWSVVALGVIAIAALQIERPKSVGTGAFATSVVREESDVAAVPKTGKSAEAYAEFLNIHGYYGAFAVGRDGGFGWSDNYASQDFADRSALEYCAARDTDCRIIARLRPDKEIRLSDWPLSQTQGEALDRFLTYPGHKAIALANHGVWGAAWNRKTRADAEQGALANCRARVLKHRSKTVSAGECTLFWVR